MASVEHLRLLRLGVDTWNHWREKTNETPDLSGAHINGANFCDIDFSFANFTDANLSYSGFQNADFSSAVMSGADLRYTRLSNSSLVNTNLVNARLANSDLDSADLTLANLSYADCSNVLFKRTTFGATIICDTTLQGAIGLDDCRHSRPSPINLGTIVRSPKLPLNFLRGCGLTDTFIEYIPSLLSDPIQFYSCFISYSSKDEQFAERLHADLQNKGVRCWYAPHDLMIGERIRFAIDESIKVHEKLLVILSEEAINSDWVEKEVETALEEERREKRTILFPIRLDDRVLTVESGWAADVRRSRNIGDFTTWKNHDAYQLSLTRLLRDLKAINARRALSSAR